MIKTLGFFLIGGFISISAFSQQTSHKNLKNQVSFCKEEVERLEGEVDNYKQLLKEQDTAVRNLKIQLEEREEEKVVLETKVVDLESASVVLLDVGLGLEKDEKYVEALKMYKLIKNIYPGTLESSSATFRIKKIHQLLRSVKTTTQEKETKKKK